MKMSSQTGWKALLKQYQKVSTKMEIHIFLGELLKIRFHADENVGLSSRSEMKKKTLFV